MSTQSERNNMSCWQSLELFLVRHMKVFAWIGVALSTACFLLNITLFVFVEELKLFPRKFQIYTFVGGSMVTYIVTFIVCVVVICMKDELRQNREDPRVLRSASIEIPVAVQSYRENRNVAENGFDGHLPSNLSTIPLKQSTKRSPPVYENLVLESDFEHSSTDEERSHQVARRHKDRQSVGRHLYQERDLRNKLIKSREAEGRRMKHLTVPNISPTVLPSRQQMTTSFIGQNGTPETHRRASEQNIPDLVTELGRHDRNSARTCSNWSSASSLAIPQHRSETAIDTANQDLRTRSCSVICHKNVPNRSPSKALQQLTKRLSSPEKRSDYSDVPRKYWIPATTDYAVRASKINITDVQHTREGSRNTLDVQASYPTPLDDSRVPKTRKSPVEFTSKLSRESSESIISSGKRNMTGMHHDSETTRQFDVLGIPEISPRIERTSPTPPLIPDCRSSPASIKKLKSLDGFPVTPNKAGYHEQLSPQKWLLAWHAGTQGVPSADTERVNGVRV